METASAAVSPHALVQMLRQRRALLFVDLVESVRLMHRDESAVIARWLEFVVAARALCVLSGGRLVKSHGDGLLLEFETSVGAVRTALALHNKIEELNDGQHPGSRMGLRIGIHVADVVVDALDLFGVGVNLTARLATLANCGQTVISAEIRDDVSDVTEWQFEDLGACFLKHFDRPVRAYRIADPQARGAGLEWTDHRPAVAVVPFTPKSGDGSALVLGDVIADEVIAAFSRQPTLRVVSRLSTSALRDIDDPTGIAIDLLKVPFLLTGRYHAGTTDVALNMKLTDARTGTVLWSEGLRANINDIMEGQDAAIETIVRCVSYAIVRVTAERVRTKPVPNLEDYALYVGAIALMHRVGRHDFTRARELLEHLAMRHPRSAAPLAQLAKWHVIELAQGWVSDRQAAGIAADSFARRALDLEPEHSLALAMRAAALGQVGGDLEEALVLAGAATQADAQEPHAWLTLGGVHSWLGQGAAAEAHPLRALALSPLDPARFLFEVFVAAGKLAVGRPEEAAQAAASSLRRNAMHFPSHRLLIVALVFLDRLAEAHAAADRMLQLEPSFKVSEYERRYAGRGRPHALERARALRAAGLPD